VQLVLIVQRIESTASGCSLQRRLILWWSQV